MLQRSIALVLAVLTAAGCYSARPAPADTGDQRPHRAVPYSAEKRVLVERMERRMNELLRRYQARIESIRQELTDKLAHMEPPVRLKVVDRRLAGYGAAEEEQYVAAIDRSVDDAVARITDLVGREEAPKQPRIVGKAETEAFATAAEIGGGGKGAAYGFVSGIAEIDERAQVTVELLQGIADIASLRDMGALRKAELLGLTEAFRHDLTVDELAARAPELAAVADKADTTRPAWVGRFLIFRSDVLEDFRLKDQDTYALVLAFQNERFPTDRKLEMVQGTRFRVVRGGTVVQDTGWRLDPQTPNHDGRLGLRADLVDPRLVASEPQFPAVNVDHSLFPQLSDFTVDYDYKTAVIDTATGEELGAMSWQQQWIVSPTGQVRLLESVAPSFDTEHGLVASLMKAGTTADAAGRQPVPSDLLDTRVLVTDPATPPIARDVADGKKATFVQSLGTDHFKLTAEGRRFLIERRMRMLAQDTAFVTYLDGQKNRYVLGLTDIAKDSVLNDLGFRRNDAVFRINGVDIARFSELWNYFVEHPREKSYVVGVLRAGAYRMIRIDVEGAPPEGVEETLPVEEMSEEMVERLNRLFEDGAK